MYVCASLYPLLPHFFNLFCSTWSNFSLLVLVIPLFLSISFRLSSLSPLSSQDTLFCVCVLSLSSILSSRPLVLSFFRRLLSPLCSLAPSLSLSLSACICLSFTSLSLSLSHSRPFFRSSFSLFLFCLSLPLSLSPSPTILDLHPFTASIRFPLTPCLPFSLSHSHSRSLSLPSPSHCSSAPSQHGSTRALKIDICLLLRGSVHVRLFSCQKELQSLLWTKEE